MILTLLSSFALADDCLLDPQPCVDAMTVQELVNHEVQANVVVDNGANERRTLGGIAHRLRLLRDVIARYKGKSYFFYAYIANCSGEAVDAMDGWYPGDLSAL